MKNSIYENFSKMKFNEKDNFNIIMEKINDNGKKREIKYFNVASMVAVIMILIGFISPAIYAKYQYYIQFKEYENREYEVGYSTIEEVNNSGYIENINMDYITQDNIGVKIDSLLIVNDYMEVKLNFKFQEDMMIDSENFSYGFAIYDESNNIYGIVPRTNIEDSKAFTNYTKNIYKELGIKYNPLDIFAIQLNAGAEKQNISAENYNIISKIKMNGKDKFPQSKKLYVRVFDLGFYTYTNEERIDLDFKVSDLEWIFELDIPEKFYFDNDIKMIVKDVIPEIKVNEILVDDIRMKVVLEWDGYEKFILENNADNINELITILDEDGNIYYMTNGSSYNDSIIRYFEINKNMLNKKLFLRFKINDTEYLAEIISK